MRKFATISGALAVVTALLVTAGASSHREAPLISADPLADNTDFYMFVSPTRADHVVLVANVVPLQAPYGGPNFFRFDDTALYEIMIDNDGDAVEDVTFQFEFDTEIRNPNTFLYNTGPIATIDSQNWNVRQFYDVTRVDGPRRRGRGMTLATRLPTPPVNVGARSIPNYDAVAGQAVQPLPGGALVFAGQRDDPFFVDLNVFDLLANPLVDGDFFDTLAGFNVHTIALEVPISSITANNSRPTSVSDPNAVIGAWATVSRPSVTTRRGGQERTNQRFVQVSRLGQPLVNEVVLPLALKDAFNALEPTGDAAAAADFVLDPEVPKLLNALFGVSSPPAPRNDLVTIFLTGIPGLNQPAGVTPAEMLRLNVAVPTTAAPNPLGVIGGDPAGFPNGRRLVDDVVDIALRAMAGATPLTPAFNVFPNNILGDGIDQNDKPFATTFPYVASPHPGNR